METAKLGKKGQLSIPKTVLDRVGIEGGTLLAVEATNDGAIVLRQLGVYPLEIYSEERLKEFTKADQMTALEKRKIAKRRRR